MRDLGVSVQGVAVGEDAARSGPTFDVLPSAQRGEREKPGERLLKQSLAAAALVLLVAALAIPALRKRSEVHAIKPALDKAFTEAQATDTLVRDLERQVADYNFLLAKKHGSGPALAYIEEVARLLPDNTWLQQFELKTTGKVREVQVSGETASSSKLIEILEQSTLLQNAAPRGTITRGTQPGSERFVIAAETRPRQQPETKPVTEVQVPPPPSRPPQATAAPAAPTQAAPGKAAPPKPRGG
jgi:general secretion pathway protein L